MADEEHVSILKQGVSVWNAWRREHADIRPDLSGANLRRADLVGVILEGVSLFQADLREARLCRAKLVAANMASADLAGADLQGAELSRATLVGANLVGANLSDANLFRADLTTALLVETNIEGATFTRCSIYGISTSELKGEPREQKNLIITPENETVISVNNLEIAQLIHLLLYNEKIRYVIDTLRSKVVLVLGRFIPERRAVLDAIQDELRKHDYLPVLFDLKKPVSREFINAMTILSPIAQFIIADVTDPRVILEELPSIMHNSAVPVKPLLLGDPGNEPVSLYDLRRNYCSLLDAYLYRDLNDLLASLEEKVIAPAEAKVEELKKNASNAS